MSSGLGMKDATQWNFLVKRLTLEPATNLIRAPELPFWGSRRSLAGNGPQPVRISTECN
jgi:hypothetical protein